MTVTHDLSILSLISQASVLVQLVMALLASLSLVSWYWIFRKAFQIRQARAQTDEFERDFWSGGDLNTLYESAGRHQSEGMERIFEAGYREFTKLRGKGLDHGAASWTAPAAPCAPPTSARSMTSRPTWPSSPRWARCRPTSACSAPCGGS